MFDFLKSKKEPKHVEALTNQTIGGQSVLYRLFRQGLGVDDSHIRKLELTYFAASVTTFVYLHLSNDPNKEKGRVGMPGTTARASNMPPPIQSGRW